MTNQPTIYTKRAELYDLMYSYKDYKSEVDVLVQKIKENGRSSGKKLLDAGCGTGRHLEYLAKAFDVTGIDINKGMLQIAAKRVPAGRFVQDDITNLKIQDTFDVIACLLSVIGYAQTYEGLQKAIQGLADRLKPGGVLLIEPWFSKGAKEFRVNAPFMETYDGPDIKIARVSFGRIEGDVSVLDTHYLVGDTNGQIYTFTEVHRLGLFERDKFLAIMRQAGLQARLDHTHDNLGRGMYIGVKK